MASNEQEIAKYGLYAAVIVVLIGASIALPLYEVLGGTGAALGIHGIVIATLLRMLWGVMRTIKIRTQGASGELGVRSILRGLDDRFRVLGSVVIGNKGDIDFIVVGPTGVWVIEVKSHKGRIRVEQGALLRDNRPFDKNFLRQVWGATYALKDALRNRFPKALHIQPVVVFSSPYAKLGVELNKADNAYVIGVDQLVRLVERQEIQHLSADEVERITESIRGMTKRI